VQGIGVDNSDRQQAQSESRKRKFRIILVLVVVLLLNIAGTWIGHLANFQFFPRHDALLNSVVLTAVAIYVLLMATPFMPGIEVGLAVMWILGAKSALLIYLCTLLALAASYLVGKFFPLRRVHQFLRWLYLQRASDLVRQLEPLGARERLDLLINKAPNRITPFLLKNRYLTIAAILNLPGNALVGGGGGIGLVVGMSRIVPFHKYLLTVAISVLPVPLFIYLQGI